MRGHKSENLSPMGTMRPGSSYIQEITVSMENVNPEGTEDQSVTSPIREALVRNVHVRRSKRIRKYPQRYDPGFGADRE